jgi:hypothetical protein
MIGKGPQSHSSHRNGGSSVDDAEQLSDARAVDQLIIDEISKLLSD